MSMSDTVNFFFVDMVTITHERASTDDAEVKIFKGNCHFAGVRIFIEVARGILRDGLVRLVDGLMSRPRFSSCFEVINFFVVVHIGQHEIFVFW